MTADDKKSGARARAKIIRAYLREYRRKNPCVSCGLTRLFKALVPLNGQGKISPKLSLRTIQSRLKTHYKLQCIRCTRTEEGRIYLTDAFIRENLTAFKQLKEFLSSSSVKNHKRVTRIAMDLYRQGITCLCGRRLAHLSRCKELRDLRNRAVTAAPSKVSLPSPVRPGCKANNSCPFPVSANGMCQHHNRFFVYPESMTGTHLVA